MNLSVNGIKLNNAGYIKTQHIKNEAVQNFNVQNKGNINFTSNSLEAPLNTDAFEKNITQNNDINALEKEFDEIKNSQGFIGKVWDGIKNLLHTKNASNSVEDIIKKAKNGEISADAAIERLNKYKEGQKMCVDIIGDIVSGIGAVGAAALAPVTGGASLLVAAGAGAGIKTLIKTTDAVIAGREYGITDFGYDIVTGSINGVMAPLSNAIGGAAGTGVAKALGLEAVETCAKEAAKEAGKAGVKEVSKSFISRLLAKQGTSYVIKEGAKGGIGLVAAKAASYGVDMAVDGALSGATDAFARALAEGRFEDMPEDMLKGTFGGAIGGVAIGGSTRLIFNSATKLNQKIFNNVTDSVSEIKLNEANLDASTVKFSNLNAENVSDEICISRLQGAGIIDADTTISFTRHAFNNLDDSAKALLEANPVLKNFYETLDDASLARLTAKQIEDDLLDEAFMKGLSIDFSNTTINAGTQEARNLASVISKRNAYLQKSSVAQFEAATSGTNVDYFNRSKQFGSTLDKINSKLSKMPASSFDEVNQIVADGIGTRAIFKSINGEDALKILKNADITDGEIQILKNLWNMTDISDITVDEAALLNKANGLLAQAQTQGFVDRLAKAIQNNEISMTEINNYAGRDGIAYFSESQIKQLHDAWLESIDAQNGYEFKVVTKITKDGNLARALGFDNEQVAQISKESAKKSGYTACQTNFKYSNSALGEGQFRGAEVQKFAEYEHFPYDIKKGKNTVTEKIMELASSGKIDVAEQLDEYQTLVRIIAQDDSLYSKYNDYLRQTYNYLRKKELGILDIADAVEEPVLNLPGLTAYQNELLSKECLESLSNKEAYTFVNKKAA